MKMTNAQMFDSIPVLQQAKNETGMLGYAIAVNMRRLASELVEYSRKRDELLAEFGTPVEDRPGSYNLTKDQADAWQEALRPFAMIETDVAVLQVPPETFYSGSLTSGQMFALAWMVKEE
jgi:hypothetical protein